MVKISPSLLSADFACLGKEAEEMRRAGADMLHFDVMDGQFVPNLSFGAPVLKCLDRCTEMFLDVHLMIADPIRYIKDFAAAGADLITFHLEAAPNPDAAITAIRSLGKRVGISIKPATHISALAPYLDKVDMVLIMTVEPGFGGQSFMADMLPKVSALREIAPTLDIQVDGGINAETAKLCREAGANILVAGSYVFGAADRKAAVDSLRV